MAHGKANQGVECRQRISFFALGAAEEVVRCQSRRNDQRAKVVRRGVRRENQEQDNIGPPFELFAGGFDAARRNQPQARHEQQTLAQRLQHRVANGKVDQRMRVQLWLSDEHPAKQGGK